MKAALRALALCFLSLAVAGCDEPADPLPRLGAKLQEVSVSGLSSGAYMAGQFHFAHNEIVTGAGLVAGGPYGCVESLDNPFVHIPGLKAVQAASVCMAGAYASLGLPDASALARRARRYAGDGKIDPVSALRGDRVYLFTGSKDRIVATSIVAAAAELYEELGLPRDAIAFSKDRIGAAHAFVTEEHGARCGRTAADHLTDCDYDQAGAILAHIYGPLAAPSPQPAGQTFTFDQGTFTAGMTSHGLAGEGVVYIPERCAGEAGCRVHIVFHGCRQGREFIGDAFIEKSGFARWADGNALILLFPEIAKSAANPEGCWDWWGYTGADYYTRRAPQIRAVRAMLERLAERRE